MKTTRNLIQICLQCAAMLPGVARAQFQFTIHNDSSLNLYQYIGSGGDVIIIPDATHGCDGLVAVRQKGLREIFQRLREIHALRQLPAIKNPKKWQNQTGTLYASRKHPRNQVKYGKENYEE
jgi:hypothetical protein